MTKIQERNNRIIDLVDSGIKNGAVADMFGLSINSIYQIISRGKTSDEPKFFNKPIIDDVPKGDTMDLLRNKHKHKLGSKVRVFNTDTGRYIKSTVIQRTPFQIIMRGKDNLTYAVAFQRLACEPALIKEGW